jgi:hypothetical protein
MKLSSARPCDGCGQPWLTPTSTGYVVRISQAMLSPRAANETLALTQILGGNLAVAEVFAPRAKEAILVFGEREPALWTELLLCTECYCKPRSLAGLVEQRNRMRELGEDPLSGK